MSSFFFFYKIRKKEGGTGLGGEWYQTEWGGEEVGEGGRRINMLQMLCICVCKWKMIPVEIIPGMGGGEEKEMVKGVNSNIIY
jgi:hypothetical protein